MTAKELRDAEHLANIIYDKCRSEITRLCDKLDSMISKLDSARVSYTDSFPHPKHVAVIDIER